MNMRGNASTTLLAIAGLAVGLCVRPQAAVGQYPLQRPGEPPFQDEASAAPAAGSQNRAVRERNRVPCEEVVARNDHDIGVSKGRSINLSALSKELGTTTQWAGHCLLAYGRRVPEDFETAGDEDQLENLEAEEPEETAPEDVEEPGARERSEVADENSRDRAELHVDNPLKPAPEKERVLRLYPEPANEDEVGGYEGLEGYQGFEGFGQETK